VDVKTKKSKEVSVRCFGRREWESGDRFRLFFFFSFPFFFFPCGRRQNRLSLSRGLKKEEFLTTKRRRAEAAAFTRFFSLPTNANDWPTDNFKLSSFTSQPHRLARRSRTRTTGITAEDRERTEDRDETEARTEETTPEANRRRDGTTER
jgi:hypothetical protein